MMLSRGGDETGKQKRQQRERERRGMKMRVKTSERAKRAGGKNAEKHAKCKVASANMSSHMICSLHG